MVSEDLERRLLRLVKRYRAHSRDVAFRNAYEMAVSEAVGRNWVSREEAEKLVRIRKLVELWSSKDPPAPKEALEQWLELRQSGAAQPPAALMEALMARFPREKGVKLDWSPIVVDPAGMPLLKILLSRRILGVPDLARFAKARPVEFYQSPALDVLLERAKPCPWAVWNEFKNGIGRPDGLLEPGAALVRSFSLDRSTNANKWFFEFLVQSPHARKRILTALLQERKSALRLFYYIELELGFQKAKAKKNRRQAFGEVLVDWVGICEAGIGTGRSTETTASILLGMIKLSILGDPTALPDEVGRTVSSNMRRITGTTVLRALTSGEQDDRLVKGGMALVVEGDELYDAVQEYLRHLPVGGSGGDVSPERALRFERHRAQKEIVEGLVSAIQTEAEPGPLRDAVEVVLFNAGVRRYSDPGDEVLFDAHLHEPMTAGILPGDRVAVLEHGHRLGGQQDGLVLVKAKVTLLASEDGSQ